MNPVNPYKGLFPYTPQDERFFFGREKESVDLIEMIKKNKLVVLFGESGTGKTSLINAKLFPCLRNQYYFPIYIRINFASSTAPIDQAKQIIYRELNSWDDSVPGFMPDTSLLEYASQTSVFKGLVKPILFFDQFEELFTIAPRYNTQDNTGELINQLAELIESERLPAKYIEKATTEGKHFSLEEKNENLLRFKVVFSLRQDFIAQLDDLRFKIPSINSGRYRIKKFNYVQAYEAIIGPSLEMAKDLGIAKDSGTIITEEAAFQSIRELGKPTLTTLDDVIMIKQTLDDVRKRFPFTENSDMENLEFDPTILSLYCYQLFEDAKETSKDIPRITLEQVKNSPYDHIIRRYYDSSLPRRRIRRSIEKLLITPDGRKVLMPLADFVARSGISEEKLEELRKETAIIRFYGKGDNRDLEIAHDQIAQQALISKKQREANKIKRDAAAIFLTALTLVILGTSFANYYVKQKRRNVDVQVLSRRNDSLVHRNDRLTAEYTALEDNYKSVLANKNTLITNNDEINKQVSQIKNQLAFEISKGQKLSNEVATIQTQFKQLADKNNSISKELTIAQGKASYFEKESASWQNKVKIYSDSADIYRRNYYSTRSRLNNLEAENKKLINENRRLNDQLRNAGIKYGMLADSIKH